MIGAVTTNEATLGDHLRRAGLIAWSLIGIALVVYGFMRYLIGPIAIVFPPLAIALVVTYILNPVVSVLVRRGAPRWAAVLGIYVLFLGVVSVALAFLIPLIARQVSEFIDELPRYVADVVAAVNRFAARRGFDFRIEVTSQQILDSIQSNRETIVSFLGGVRSVAGQIIHIVITVILGIILSIYLLLDLPKMQVAVTNAIPRRHRDEVLQVLDKVGGALGGFFRGQLLVAAFVGVASAIGLTLIKLPFAVLIGLLAGVFNLVPLIGPFIAAVPAVSVALLSPEPSRAIWAGLVLLIVQQIDNHVISPNVMGRTVRLHPVTVMLALLAGAAIAGIWGMLVVIPAVAAVKIIAVHVWAKREEFGLPDGVQAAGEDAQEALVEVEQADGGETEAEPVTPRRAAKRAGRGSSRSRAAKSGAKP